MLTRLIAVIISQFIHILNHYAIDLKLIYYYMSVIFQKKKLQKIDSSFSEIWASVFNLPHMKENEHKTLYFTLKSF